MLKNNKKRAFTLAEVMIAISLIGVLASFSIPTIGSSVHKRAKLSEFRTAYAILNTALKNAYTDKGTIYGCYDVPNKDSIEDGAYEIANGTASATSGCAALETVFTRNLGVTRKCDKDPYKQGCVPKGYPLIKPLFDTKQAFVLNNSMILIPSTKGSISTFAIDINGRKGPNRWGQDIFPFTMMVTKSIQTSSGLVAVKTVEITAPNDDAVADYFADSPLIDTTRQMISKSAGRKK